MAKRSLKRLFSTGNRVEEAATFPTSRANGIFVHSPKPVCEETGFQLDWREKDETGTKKSSFSRNKHGGAEVKKKVKTTFLPFRDKTTKDKNSFFATAGLKILQRTGERDNSLCFSKEYSILRGQIP